jgi:hypothetical protein
MSLKRLTAIAVLLGASCFASSAFAHAKLQASDPKAGSVLAVAPKAVRLTFNEALEPSFSKLAVVDAANAAVALKHSEVDKANPKVMTVALPPLHAGQYRVQWSAVTSDGHRVKGEFGFGVK